MRPQPQALRTGAGAGFACEPSQKPPASLVLPQPQRLRAGAGVEGTWDMVMEKPEQEAARPPAQVVSRVGRALLFIFLQVIHANL